MKVFCRYFEHTASSWRRRLILLVFLFLLCCRGLDLLLGAWGPATASAGRSLGLGGGLLLALLGGALWSAAAPLGGGALLALLGLLLGGGGALLRLLGRSLQTNATRTAFRQRAGMFRTGRGPGQIFGRQLNSNEGISP